MNFYTQILDALKAKFQGVSETILTRIATKMAKTVTTEEQVQSTVDGYTLQQVIDSYADSRATEATRTAVESYEKKHNLKDGKRQKTKEDKTDTKENTEKEEPIADKTPEWAKSFTESMTKLTERLDKMEGDRRAGTRRETLTKIVGNLPEALRKPYERMNITDISDEEFNQLTVDVKAEVDGITKDLNVKGAIFGAPTVGRKNKGAELSKSQIEAITHRDNVDTGDEEAQPF